MFDISIAQSIAFVKGEGSDKLEVVGQPTARRGSGGAGISRADTESPRTARSGNERVGL